MNSFRWLPCAFALSLVPSLASADEPPLTTRVQRRVETELVEPLAARETRFSRSRPEPRERRVRVTQSTVTVDKKGRGFVPFAIDVRFGSEWSQNDIVGCAYEDGALFVKKGDSYRPASFLLGKKADPVRHVCEAVPVARS